MNAGPSIAHHRTLAVNFPETFAALAMAALVLQPLFGSMAASLFLLFGALLGLCSPGRNIRELITWWPLLVLPAYCLASTLWSQFPDETLRYGIELLATLAIAVVIGTRVPAEKLLSVLFALFSIGIVLSMVLGRNQDGRAWLGMFGSKNAFAGFVVLYAVLSAGTVLDRQTRPLVRAAAALGLIASAVLLLRAESAGALIEIVPVLLIVAGVVWSRRLTQGQVTFLLALVAVALIALVVVALAFRAEVLDLILSSAGKDTTLTGRTDLWSIGLSIIAEHPWLGVGYRAFWVEGYGPAEQLWAMFQQPSGAGFNFHNLYNSTAVELGAVGLLLESTLIYVPLLTLLVLAIVRPDPTIATLLGLQVLLVLGSAVEVGVFFEFTLRSVMAYVTIIYAAQAFEAWRADVRPPTRRIAVSEPA